MQVTDGVAEVIRVELARRRTSVEAFTAALTYPGTSRPVLSFRSMCRRLAEPGTFKLEELAAIADYFGLEISDLISPSRRAA
jgi:hypothetical protein